MRSADHSSQQQRYYYDYESRCFYVVLFSLYIFFQRTQNDPFFFSEENFAFQEIMAVKNIRRETAEDFVVAVVNCISPPILPGQILNGAASKLTRNYGNRNLFYVKITILKIGKMINAPI